MAALNRKPKRVEADQFIGASTATLRRRVENMIHEWNPEPGRPLDDDHIFQSLKAHVAEILRRQDLPKSA
jgi:DNA-directed RNA polymerase specialized sigma54-like protein